MPLFSYECPKCGREQDAYRTVAERNRAPKCCGRKTVKIVTASYLTPQFTPYRAVGKERGKMIRSRGEHRDYLKRHGYEEVGNDKSMAPEMEATDGEWAKHQTQRRAQLEREVEQGAALVASLTR